MRIRLVGACILSASLLILNSCKDDPAPPSLISFSTASQDVIESDGTQKSVSPELVSGGVGQSINVKITFDRPMADNSVISYTVTGTASRQTTTKTSGTSSYKDYSDFYLDGTNAKATESLIVNKGDTEAVIPLTIFEDYDFEDDETIILTLTSVVSGPAKLSDTNLDYTINIKEDDAVFFLDWVASDAADPNGPGDVDLDMIVTLAGSIVNTSQAEGQDAEALYIPAGFPAGTYSWSYPYYSGTSNSVKFASFMFSTAGTLNGKSYPYNGDNNAAPLTFSGTYTLANVNKYTDATKTAIVQTMVKSGINYTNISGISVPATGSRTAPVTFDRSKLKNMKLKMINSSSVRTH